MAQKAYIDIIDIDNQTLLDSKRNDIAFYTLFGSQKILMSAGSNVNSKLCITSNNIGIGTVNPRVKLDVSSTDALQIPIGTIIDRNNFSNNWNSGQIRYNTITQQYEGYANNMWITLGGISGVTDTNNDTYISAENGPGINNDELKFFTSNIEKMRITTNGNIGIGTTNPGEKLHVFNSNSNSNAVLRIQDYRLSNINTRIDFYNSNNINGSIGYSNSQDLFLNNSASNGSLRLYTSNTERLTVLNNGFIGIGNTNPMNNLDIIGNVNINGSANISSFTSTTSTNLAYMNSGNFLEISGISGLTYIDFHASANSNASVDYNARISASDTRLYLEASNNIGFATNGTEKVRINVVGNVGIGTTNPQSALHVIGDATITTNLNVLGNTTISSNIDVSGTTILRSNVLITTGNIGIGTTTPNEIIHIYGSNQAIRIQSTRTSNFNTRLDFYNSNSLNGSIGYSNSQDLSLNNSASNGSLRLYTNITAIKNSYSFCITGI